MTLSGNRETCINCGQWAETVDGIYNVVNGVPSLVDGPPFSHFAVTQFKALLEKAAKNEIDIDQLEKDAEAIDPRLGAAVRLAKHGPWWLVALFLLVFALSKCDTTVEIKLDLNQAIDQVLREGTTVPGQPDSSENSNRNYDL